MSASAPSSSVAPPRLVALELTRRCVLACRHCRASAGRDAKASELSAQEWLRVLDSLAASARPTIILTGGEPLLREDVCDIAAHAAGKGLRVVLATCGTGLDDALVRRLVAAGVAAISVSLDGATAETHDAFRGTSGAFGSALGGIEAARRAGLAFQINAIVHRGNLADLEAMLGLAVSLGAATFNPFVLVPSGRAKEMKDQALSAAEYARTLDWLAEQERRGQIPIRVTCAPHYALRRGGAADGGGCLGGRAFAFVSHEGSVQACGFLEVECGDLRRSDYDFARIWWTAPVFLALRDRDGYHGPCGECPVRATCGGCRARALADSGDYLGADPLCDRVTRRGEDAGASEIIELDAKDKELLWLAQTQFPVAPRPFELLAKHLATSEAHVLERLRRWHESGVVRRVGAVFDSRRLDYISTLVAARVSRDRLEEVAALIGAMPGVTHNYARRHRFNLWFTLTAESQPSLDAALDELRARSGVEELVSLPAEKVYKLQAVFAPPGLPNTGPAGADPPSVQPGPAVRLDASQHTLVAMLAGDLPIVEEPFDALAARIGWAPQRVLRQVQQWLDAGVIRRFGAVVSHRRLGYVANALAAFRVEQQRVDAVGAALATLPQVSHCYRRRPCEAFDYNLFAMIHGQSEDSLRRAADGFAASARVTDYCLLFTEREFARSAPAYFV